MIFFGNKRIAIPSILALSSVIYLLVFWRTTAADKIISALQQSVSRVPSAAGQACDCRLQSSQRGNGQEEKQVVVEKKVIVSTTHVCTSPSRSATAAPPSLPSPTAGPKYEYGIVMAHVLDYPLYNEALKLTERYCETNGYDLRILRENVMGDFYTKTVQAFQVIAQELAKAEGERLKWILYVNSDSDSDSDSTRSGRPANRFVGGWTRTPSL